MEKIILFYKYVHIISPKQVLKWQKKLCAELGLKGRILLGHEGINGTLGGTNQNIDRYCTAMEKSDLFTDIDYKESSGSADCFPRMQITIKDEIVRLGIAADALTPADGGKHLEPHEVHTLLQTNPKDLVILDTRNDFEWKVGKFTDAITPPIKHFRELPAYIDHHEEQFKDKQVLMYCTGGIRCERATAYLNKKNIAKQVYQIKGGIHRYAEQYPDGYFRGKNYVFDGRVAVKVTDDILGSCLLCTTPCDTYTNCINVQCNKHFISCAQCLKTYNNSCSTECMNKIANNEVALRPTPCPTNRPTNKQ